MQFDGDFLSALTYTSNPILKMQDRCFSAGVSANLRSGVKVTGLCYEFLYRDESIFALNKPAGVHCVENHRTGNPSIASNLIEQFPTLKFAGRTPEDGGLVQRLDFSTSGVLLGAWSKDIWQKLFDALQSGAIDKEYLVIVEGHFPQEEVVELSIGARHRRSAKVQTFSPNDRHSRGALRALPAKTLFRCLRYCSKSNASIVSAKAGAAKRHQIRAHAAAIGFPLVGDHLYGAKTLLSELKLFRTNCLQIDARDFFLHALSTTLEHPVNRNQITVESAVGDLFDTALG